MSKPVDKSRLSPKCAMCAKRPVEAKYRPFCSKRCADLDLAKWLGDGYAIPGEPADQADETLPGPKSDDG